VPSSLTDQIIVSELAQLGIRQDLLEARMQRVEVLIVQQNALNALPPPNMAGFLVSWWEEYKPRRKAKQMPRSYCLQKLVEWFKKTGK